MRPKTCRFNSDTRDSSFGIYLPLNTTPVLCSEIDQWWTFGKVSAKEGSSISCSQQRVKNSVQELRKFIDEAVPAAHILRQFFCEEHSESKFSSSGHSIDEAVTAAHILRQFFCEEHSESKFSSSGHSIDEAVPAAHILRQFFCEEHSESKFSSSGHSIDEAVPAAHILRQFFCEERKQ
ncbi:hypothetical protein BaRGS_00005099 [Batillaria attramentaria]|uniref:Uncharacterized protein n=1 Tax=Batillaria attramentaria TaxID=370345 RepID=A0ABD0LVP1_9CAEN